MQLSQWERNPAVYFFANGCEWYAFLSLCLRVVFTDLVEVEGALAVKPVDGKFACGIHKGNASPAFE